MTELGEAAEDTKVKITDKPEEIKDDPELGNDSEDDDRSDDLKDNLPTEGDKLSKVCLMKLINLVLECLIVFSKDEVDKSPEENNEDKNEDDHKSMHAAHCRCMVANMRLCCYCIHVYMYIYLS